MDVSLCKNLAEYVVLQDSIVTELTEKVAALQAEKTASAVSTVSALPKEQIASAADKLAAAKLIAKSEKEAFAVRVAQEPAILLGMLEKVAQLELDRVPSLGKVSPNREPVIRVKGSDQLWNERFGK